MAFERLPEEFQNIPLCFYIAFAMEKCKNIFELSALSRPILNPTSDRKSDRLLALISVRFSAGLVALSWPQLGHLGGI